MRRSAFAKTARWPSSTRVRDAVRLSGRIRVSRQRQVDHPSDGSAKNEADPTIPVLGTAQRLVVATGLEQKVPTKGGTAWHEILPKDPQPLVVHDECRGIGPSRPQNLTVDFEKGVATQDVEIAPGRRECGQLLQHGREIDVVSVAHSHEFARCVVEPEVSCRGHPSIFLMKNENPINIGGQSALQVVTGPVVANNDLVRSTGLVQHRGHRRPDRFGGLIAGNEDGKSRRVSPAGTGLSHGRCEILWPFVSAHDPEYRAPREPYSGESQGIAVRFPCGGLGQLASAGCGMSAPARSSGIVRGLEVLAGSGKPGKVLAARLDRFRVAGLGSGRAGWQVTGRGSDAQLFQRQAALYRRIWGEAAEAVDARIEELGDEFLSIRRDGVETIVRFHLVMADHPATIALALDKPVVHRLLRTNGVPVPDYCLVDLRSRAEATAFLLDAGPCVVKPANGTGGGAGVTCGVESPDDLGRAWLAAAPFDDDILVERAVSGEEYRLLFLDGQLIDVICRARPTVEGDGRSTVIGLMSAENRRRLESGSDEVARLLRLDVDAALALRAGGWSPHSVPALGQRVVVKGTVGENARADNTTVQSLAPSLVSAAARAVALTRLRLAGVDLVTPDPHGALEASGGAILEVNGTPGLHYHYEVASPELATKVAVPILDRLLTPLKDLDSL